MNSSFVFRQERKAYFSFKVNEALNESRSSTNNLRVNSFHHYFIPLKIKIYRQNNHKISVCLPHYFCLKQNYYNYILFYIYDSQKVKSILHIIFIIVHTNRNRV